MIPRIIFIGEDGNLVRKRCGNITFTHNHIKLIKMMSERGTYTASITNFNNITFYQNKQQYKIFNGRKECCLTLALNSYQTLVVSEEIEDGEEYLEVYSISSSTTTEKLTELDVDTKIVIENNIAELYVKLRKCNKYTLVATRSMDNMNIDKLNCLQKHAELLYLSQIYQNVTVLFNSIPCLLTNNTNALVYTLNGTPRLMDELNQSTIIKPFPMVENLKIVWNNKVYDRLLEPLNIDISKFFAEEHLWNVWFKNKVVCEYLGINVQKYNNVDLEEYSKLELAYALSEIDSLFHVLNEKYDENINIVNLDEEQISECLLSICDADNILSINYALAYMDILTKMNTLK